MIASLRKKSMWEDKF